MMRAVLLFLADLLDAAAALLRAVALGTAGQIEPAMVVAASALAAAQTTATALDGTGAPPPASAIPAAATSEGSGPALTGGCVERVAMPGADGKSPAQLPVSAPGTEPQPPAVSGAAVGAALATSVKATGSGTDDSEQAWSSPAGGCYHRIKRCAGTAPITDVVAVFRAAGKRPCSKCWKMD